jgi:hypothetical protein
MEEVRIQEKELARGYQTGIGLSLKSPVMARLRNTPFNSENILAISSIS